MEPLVGIMKGEEQVVKNLNLEIEKVILQLLLGQLDRGSLPFCLQFLARCTNYQERSAFS